jgi:probable F420-dependent oxidoreductase
MRLGLGLPVSGSWATPDAMAEVAQAAERLGYDSLWTFQRVLHPAEGDWAPVYRSVQDPLTSLAFVAGLTERVRLGVAVLNLPFFAPVLLAKQLTTLDVVSRGRLDVGLGLGWAHEEFAAVGVPFERRGARLEEGIRCLQALWGQDPVSFAGDFYTVPPSRVQPKPVQTPHPPLLLGGSSEPALRRAGRAADGWVSGSRHDLTRISEAIGVVRLAAAAAGRDPGRLRFVVRGVVHLGEEKRGQDGTRRPLTGSAGQIRGDLGTLEDSGVTEVFLDLNFNPRVGAPDADAAESRDYARTVVETFSR